MATLSVADLAEMRAIESLVATRVEGAPPILQALVDPLAELLRTERSLAYVLRPEGDRIEVESLDFDRGDEHHTRERFGEFLAKHPVGWGSYHPLRPEPRQRNRALTLDEVGEGARESSLQTQFLPQVGLGGLEQLRILICDGASLLAWVGAFQPEPFGLRAQGILQRLGPALQRRLRLERSIAGAPVFHAAFVAALEAIAVPAFLVTHDGRMVLANSVGTQAWNADRSLRTRLAQAVGLDEPTASGFTRTPVVAAGCNTHHLLIANAGDVARDAEVRARLWSASTRWGLTPRQRQVLTLVVQGHSNRAVAAELGIAERTVEVHLTAIFSRAQVETRAQLSASVLTGE